MAKSADVHILKRHQVGSGLVTITVTGEVSAVTAAVDAATVAVSCIEGGELISSHVIPNPYDEISTIIIADDQEPQPAQMVTPERAPAKVASPARDTQNNKPATVEEIVEAKEPEQKQEQNNYTLSELQKFQVNKLRRLAEGLENISLSKQAIKIATKKKLIEAILNVTK